MSDKPTVVDAHTFILRGKNGQRLAYLTANEDDEAYLAFVDKTGKPRIALGFTKDEECRLFFLDADGNQRVNIAFLPNGQVAIMGMGAPGKPAVGIRGGFDEGCGMVAISGTGKTRAVFGIDGEGYPGAAIMNPDGTVVWNAVAPDGTTRTRGGIILPKTSGA